jgi:phage tail sheath gpL-like
MSQIANIQIIDESPSAASLSQKLNPGSRMPVANAVANHMMALASGSHAGSLQITVQNGDSAIAKATLTLSGVVASDTCSVNGVSFAAVASGATGNQFNVGVSDTATAVNLAAAINASASAPVKGAVVASSSSTVVTVSAASAGLAGNGYAIAGGTGITASGSYLTGGANDSSVASLYHFGL